MFIRDDYLGTVEFVAQSKWNLNGTVNLFFASKPVFSRCIAACCSSSSEFIKIDKLTGKVSNPYQQKRIKVPNFLIRLKTKTFTFGKYFPKVNKFNVHWTFIRVHFWKSFSKSERSFVFTFGKYFPKVNIKSLNWVYKKCLKKLKIINFFSPLEIFGGEIEVIDSFLKRWWK